MRAFVPCSHCRCPVGAVRLGAMGLYRVEPGVLVGDCLADALVLADTACALLLDTTDAGGPAMDGWWPELRGRSTPRSTKPPGC
jgi:hypothetical protein